MTFINDEMPIFTDYIVNDAFPTQGLNHGHVDNTSGTPFAAADLTNFSRTDVQERWWETGVWW